MLDAGCGTGDSTRQLALLHPKHVILAVDRSQARISRAKQALSGLPNVIIARANLVDFWRLSLQSGWHFDYQYLLYPNPSPKKRQIKRRWHAHPVLPTILKLGGRLELRTEWDIYAKEFYSALELCGFPAKLERFAPQQPISAFERKYLESGHPLFRVISDLMDAGTEP